MLPGYALIDLRVMSKRILVARICAFLTFLSTSSALAQDLPASQEFRGTWIATAGASFLRGRWSGEIVSKTVNSARGNWALVNDKEQVVLAGTWSATKSANEWQGRWSARANQGKSFSGTWTADMNAGGTFEDMLRKTIETQVNGAWQSGRAQGNWALQGSP